MNMLLPQKFDENEWFLLISLCTVMFVVLLLPRQFPTIVSIVFFALGGGIAMFVDFHLGIPPMDLYDVNDTKHYELFELVAFVLYSPFAYLFAYFLDRWNIRRLFIPLYILAWSVAGTAFEALAAYFHVYKYKGWNLGFSFLFYLTIQFFTFLIYEAIKKKYTQTKCETSQEWI